MTSDHLKNALAPCGLSCEKCFASVNGDIRRLAGELKDRLGNFGIYAKRFETLVGNPVFKKYPDFSAMLDYLATDHCKGCRNEQCKLFTGCGVRACHQKRQIDYCFECEDFPCDHTGFDPHLHERWIAMNRQIQEKGIEQYYADTRHTPRYR